MKNLHDILPIWSVENDAILSKMGDVTIGFSLQLPEIFTLSADGFESFHQAWVKAIGILPAGFILCKQDWFCEEAFKADFSGEQSFLSRSSHRFFNERPYLDHHCYLYLTRKPNGREQPNSMFSTLLRHHLVPEETLDRQFFEDFLGVAGQFEKILVDSGFVKMVQLKDDALDGVIRRYLNLGQDTTVRDIAFKEGIDVGEKHCELFTLADADTLPSTCGSSSHYDTYSTDKTTFRIGFATPVGQLLSCNHIYSQYILIEDRQKMIKKLESRKLRLQSLSAYSRSNAMARQATEDFLNEVVGLGRTPVKAHFNILAWTDSREGLREIRNLCSSALTKIGASPKIETVGAPQIFWAGIPGNAADLPVNETFDTFSNQASCFLNLETNYRNSSSPIGIRLGDRVSGRPLHVDLSDEPMERGIITNRNKIIIGGSGSGKSFVNNHLNRSYHELKAHIVVVDMGHSYRGLCELAGGYYYAYSAQSPICFNPFFLSDGEKPDIEKRESIKTLLVALWKKDDEQFVRSEYVAISNALQLYYEQNIGFRCFNSFYEFLRDEYAAVLQDQQVKEKEFDLSNFLYVLRPYYRGGEFDYLLNATENLDLLHQSFIVFDIDTIKDHPILFPVVTIIIMELFISKMRRLQGVRKVILIEEAWKAIAKAGMAEYIKYLFKTVRKYFGEAAVVTQEIDDILSSEIVKQTIIANADCKILTDMHKFQHRIGALQSLMGLTDQEMVLLLSLNKANEPGRKYKEVFISLGGHAKVYRAEVSPEEYLVYTTEERERLKVQEAAKKYGSLERGIRSLVAGCLLLVSVVGYAQVPVAGSIISKVVKAIDLKVQQLQNETLVLQNIQKTIENRLHLLKLAEIRDWSQKQRALYQAYFDELKNVKPVMDSLFVNPKKW